MKRIIGFPSSRINRALLSAVLSVLLASTGLFLIDQTTNRGLGGTGNAPEGTLPDLAIFHDGITFSDDKPHNGDVIEICAKVNNIGNATAKEVRTDFYDHFGGSSSKINTTWIPEIPPGGFVNTCTPWTAHPAGIHGILVKVDPENVIEEFREDNNAADRSIEVLPETTLLPDLTFDGEIYFSNEHPKDGQVINICVTVVNIGDAGADEIPVRFIDHHHGVSTKIGTKFIAHLGPGEWAEVCIEWTATPAGEHKIVAYVDPENKIPESNELNNIIDAPLIVDPAEQPKHHISLVRFDNDGNRKLDDVVITVYGNEHDAVVGADVYIDGKFFGKTPDSGTVLAYNFSLGWHVVKAYFNGYWISAEFYSQG